MKTPLLLALVAALTGCASAPIPAHDGPSLQISCAPPLRPPEGAGRYAEAAYILELRKVDAACYKEATQTPMPRVWK